MTRRRPRLRELAAFLPGRPRLRRAGTRVERSADVADLRAAAARRTPRMVFDYVDGAAEDERSLRASTAAFDSLVFRPRVLRDVSEVSTSTSVLGREVAMPLILGPTGFTRMMHRDGEIGVATAAARAGVPYTLSCMGTTPADVLAEQSGGWNWFQLYVLRDRARNLDTLQQARAAGMDVLVLTVDVPVAGARLRDVRQGMTIPPTMSWRSVGQVLRRPAWTWDFLTSEPLSFATAGGAPEDLATMARTMFDPSVTLADLEWIRGAWDGRILIKGVQDVEDARDLAAIGVDGIVVSNHGGRQLDRSPAPLHLLPGVREAVPADIEVYLDGGIRSGADVAAAVALGATAAFAGRAYLYGLMAGGQNGVSRVLDIVRSDLVRTMQLLGASSIAHLGPHLISTPHHLHSTDVQDKAWNGTLA